MTKHFLMLFATLVFIGGFAYAQPDDDDFPTRGPLHERLNLNESQKTQMQKLGLNLQRKQTGLRAKVQSLRLDIKEQYLGDKPDRKIIEQRLKSINDTQLEMKYNMVDHWFAVNSMLTADQQKVWKEMAGKFMDRGREKMKQHLGRGPGIGPRGMRMNRP